jgi:transposase
VDAAIVLDTLANAFFETGRLRLGSQDLRYATVAAHLAAAYERPRRIASEGGVPVLKKSRWLLLKREENLKTEQRFRLRDLLRYNLKTVRACLLKEAFQQLRDYNSPAGPESSSMTGVGK